MIEVLWAFRGVSPTWVVVVEGGTPNGWGGQLPLPLASLMRKIAPLPLLLMLATVTSCFLPLQVVRSNFTTELF